MNREFVQAVIDSGESGVQGVDPDVQCTLPAVSAPPWKYELAAAGDFAQCLADRKFKPPVRTQPAHDTGSPNRPYVEPRLRGCMVCVGYSDRQ